VAAQSNNTNDAPRERRPLRTPAVALIVGSISFAARYAVTGAIENDHFVTFARALQVLYGDWPVRDFEDPGFPLSYLVSTAIAAVVGPSLLVNVLLCILLLALTSTLTYLLAFRATQSHVAAAVAAASTVIVYPRLYNATKVIVPVVAIWLAWRYADRRRPRQLIELAIWTAVAFLLRHDYFVYVTLGNAALFALCHADAPRVAITRLLTYAALALLFVAPWLLYVQAYEGLSEYFASAVRFTAAEVRRTATGPTPSMFFAFIAIPVVGILASFRQGPHLMRAQLASAAVMLLSLDLVFLRDVLATRIPDVMAPTAVVAAAIVGHLTPVHAMKRSAMSAVTVALVAAVVLTATNRPAIPRPAEAAHRLVDIAERLRRVSPEIMPNPALAPVVTYLTLCTAPDDRVLVTGFGPEIPVLAHRPFAARLPTWIPNYYENDTDVRRALVRLRDERLGAAVFLNGTNVVARSWPALLQAIRDRGFDEYGVAPVDSRLRVWLPHRVAGSSRDASTDLPCPAR
jgi:dolichyl-phosphate-mannose-protein mannosyltransferase